MKQSTVKYMFFTGTIILLVLTSGCIHIDFGNPFKSEEPKATEFKIEHKPGFPMTYEFDTFVKLNVEYSDTEPIVVKSGTEWVNITIKVVINDIQLINLSEIANYTGLERYVLVRLLDPDNEKYYEKKFIESDEVRRQLSTPTPGPWKVTVDAVGLGYQDTKDSYRIDVFAYEPE